MAEASEPVYFLVYESQNGLKRREIKINLNSRRIDGRSHALRIMKGLEKNISKADKTAKCFRIEELVILTLNNPPTPTRLRSELRRGRRLRRGKEETK